MPELLTQTMAKITIITQGDEQHDIEAPLNILASEFIDELRVALRLPGTDHDGRPIAWRLDNKDTTRTLAAEQTLEQNGVRDGHRLNLFRAVVAG